MAEPKKILEKAYNSLSKFNETLQEYALIAVYGKNQQPVEMVDFNDPVERAQLVKAIGNIRTNPSLDNIHDTLRAVNGYDLCNPLNFAVSQLFPPGSPVAEALGRAQDDINEFVNKLRSFALIADVNTIEATTLESTSFEKGDINFITRDLKPIRKGAFVTITQTNDPKITSVMRGVIKNIQSNSNQINYTVTIESISPSIPPYAKNKNGDIIRDDNGEEELATFTNFKIEYETEISSNVQELATDLNDLTRELQGIGVNNIATSINELPSSLPGIGSLKGKMQEVLNIIEDAGDQAAEAAVVTSTASGALAGNLTAEEVIERVRVLREFYNDILPYTNIKFAIQEVFKKQISDVNRILRNAIPYKEIATVIRIVVFLSRVVLSIIDTIITILNFINNIIKTILVVLKVIRVVLKVIKTVIKFLPALLVPVGAIETVTNFINKIETAISRAIDLLEKISKELESIINTLSWVKTYLQLIIKESVRLAAKLESCEGFNNSGLQEAAAEASRNNFIALKNLLDAFPALDKFEAGSRGSALINSTGVSTFVVIDGYGTLMPLADTVFGFDEFGNIIFYGDLVSLSTGVNFEDTLGQEFRSGLKYYTFDKFEAAKHGPLVQSAENVFNQKQSIVADPEDRFGNFQEIYLGYTIKIQEDKPINKNKENLLRRRGIALDSTDKIVAATDLTFGNDINQIVNEVKYKLNLYLKQGLIGINTADSSPNEIPDSQATDVAQDLGANPVGINNLKAEANNRATSNLTGKVPSNVEGTPINPNEPIETRIGGGEFVPDNTFNGADKPAEKGSPNKTINLDSLITPLVEEQKESNPQFKAIADIINTIGSVNPQKMGEILNKPGAENMSDEELLATLKSQVLSSLDPNPDKVEEVKRKTNQWYEGLRNSTRVDWEQLTLNYRPPMRPAPPSYEEYYEQIEEQELPKWIKLLLRQRYTETEIQYGIDNMDIRDKYRIKFGPNSSVKVILRPAFKKKK